MITAIIQARLGSTRLPEKVLLPFGGHTILEEVIKRVKQSRVDRTILTTPDAELRKYAKCPVHIWTGKRDLVSEYYSAANFAGADPIVRITADCPLTRPDVINLVIKEYFRLCANDYCFNRCDDEPGSWPDGLDVEVFSYKALQRAYILAPEDEREHFTWLKNNGIVYQVLPDKDYGVCVSVDTQEEYEKALQLRGGYVRS